jgi:hypothetical protein
MSGKEAAPNRCAVNDCRLPRQLGEFLCIEHKPKPPSLRESIASGPKYKDTDGNAICSVCCQPDTGVDATTGLCLGCWRAWRFSMGAKS